MFPVESFGRQLAVWIWFSVLKAHCFGFEFVDLARCNTHDPSAKALLISKALAVSEALSISHIESSTNTLICATAGILILVLIWILSKLTEHGYGSDRLGKFQLQRFI